MPPEAATAIYYTTGGARRDPVSYAEFVSLAKDGRIGPDDLVWYEGIIDWVPARQIMLNVSVGDSPSLLDNAALPEPRSAPLKQPLLKAPLKTNYFIRHWRGELSLPVSYWVNSVLGTSLIVLAFFGVAALLDGEDPASSTYYWSASTAMVVVITTWQLVGVWRSAVRRRSESPTVWASVAQVVVVMGWISLFGQVFGTFVPAIQESVAQQKWLAENGKWNTEVMGSGQEIALTGGIGRGFAADIETTLSNYPQLKTLHVNLENGGLISEADRARKVIEQKGIRTYVSDRCVSACTIVFVGGKERFLAGGAMLGFHEPKIPGFKSGESHNSPTKLAYRSAGITEAFIQRVLNTPNTTMWYPTALELKSAKIIDDIVSSELFAVAGAKRLVETGKVRAILESQRIFAAVKKVEPMLFEKLLKQTEDGYLAGKSPAQVRMDNLNELQGLRAKYMATTSAEAVTEFAGVVVAQYEFFRALSPEVCVDYFVGKDALKFSAALSSLSEPLRAREQIAMARLLEERDQNAFVPNAKEADVLIENAFAPILANPKGRKALENFAAASNGKAADPALACAGAILVVEATRFLPDRLAVPYWRAMFSR
jgi:hypothetical protein